MNCQIEMAYGRPVHQPAGDHHPACKGLGDEEHSHQKVNAEFLEGDPFCEQKIEDRKRVEQPCKTGDEAVEPLDVKNVLIFLQVHVKVDLLEFRGLLVLFKLHQPGLLADGRDRPADGIPLGDREP